MMLRTAGQLSSGPCLLGGHDWEELALLPAAVAQDWTICFARVIDMAHSCNRVTRATPGPEQEAVRCMRAIAAE